MSAPAGADLTFRGSAWVFGDEVNTDDMYPGFAMRLDVPEAAKYMFHATRPDWPTLVRPGDVVVGGRNFGIGSSRAVALLFRELGVSCVVAEEFNSLFLRNCINYGLPALPVPGVTRAVAEGQEILVDISAARVDNTATGAVLHASPYPDFILDVLAQGGLLAKLEKDGLLRASATGGG